MPVLQEARQIKRGTIYKNLWAGYETYFIYQGPAKSYKNEASKVSGYSVRNINGKWEIEKSCYYKQSLKDEEHFPVVGHIDVDSVLLNSILSAIGKETDDDNSSA